MPRQYDRRYALRVKVAVSIPDSVFRSAEELATRLGVSRSQLYARALVSLVEQHREELVTSRLNEIYGREGEHSSLEHGIGLLQTHSLPARSRPTRRRARFPIFDSKTPGSLRLTNAKIDKLEGNDTARRCKNCRR